MKKTARKLALRRETLQMLVNIELSRTQLERAVGGFDSAPGNGCTNLAVVNSFTCPK